MDAGSSLCTTDCHNRMIGAVPAASVMSVYFGAFCRRSFAPQSNSDAGQVGCARISACACADPRYRRPPQAVALRAGLHQYLHLLIKST